jgi:DNA repair protein RadD
VIIQPRKYQADSVEAAWVSLDLVAGGTVVALPTGTGKSLVCAMLIEQVLNRWPGYRGRVIVLAGRRELVEQNHAEFRALCPGERAGIYSAGLNRRDTEEDVIFAQIQSAHRCPEIFGRRNLLVVDECHEMPDSESSMYRRFYSGIQVMSPKCRMVGLSATPFRLSTGTIVGPAEDGYLFQSMAFEYSLKEAIDAGYLCNLVTASIPVELHGNLSSVGTRGGEFIQGEAQAAMMAGDLVARTVDDIIARAVGRKSGVIFTSGVQHCSQVLACLHRRGERAAMVVGDTHADNRAWTIDEFRRGAIRWLVNVNTLTVGFNAPATEVVVLLRPTQSAGLLIQMIGRGSRLSQGKTDCLILDYARNLATHGPIDTIRPKDRKSGVGGGSEGQQPMKECPRCSQRVNPRFQVCPFCSAAFPLTETHEDKPDTDARLFSESTSERFTVASVTYRRHLKKSITPGKESFPTMRVDYYTDEGDFVQRMSSIGSEWVCFSHPANSFPYAKARAWWARRSPGTECPQSVDEALSRVGELLKPTEITVFKKDKDTLPEIRNPSFQMPAEALEDLPF